MITLPPDPVAAASWLIRCITAIAPTEYGDVRWRDVPDIRPAAVLIPIVWHADVPTIVLTQRTHALREHAGQVSFAGGKLEEGERDPIAAALREAEEEIALESARVQVLGCLPPYTTRTCYRVTPVVGLLVPPLKLMAHPGEVADIFELPLSWALDPAHYQQHDYHSEGRTGSYLSLDWGPYHVWGATAAILWLFAQALR